MEYLVIDTESCTGRDSDGSLCSFGYTVCDEQFNILTQNDLIINPLPKRFAVGDSKNARRTGVKFAYTIEEFRNAPRFDARYKQIKSLFEGRTVLGFSMVNDVKYLNDACVKYSLPIIEYAFYDIQYIYKLLYPSETSVGLKTLSVKYGNEYLAHRSDEDAAASVTLLKSILAETGQDLNFITEKYGVHCGENCADGFILNYADAVISKQFGLKPSNKVYGAILSDYLHKLPQKREKVNVAFSHKIERKDVDYLRTLIDLIYENGMSFTRDTDVCTLFVRENDEEIRNTKAKTVLLSDFEKTLGFNGIKQYDDKEFLTEYYSRKITETPT